MAYKDIILANSPVWYHEFKNQTATVGSNTVTWSGATNSVEGPKNTKCSAYFDGVNDSITIANMFDFAADTTWAFECWVKFGAQSMDYPTFMRRDGNGKTYLVRTRGPGSAARVGDIESYYNGRSDYFNTAFNDSWHHVAYIRNSSTFQLYVDGTVAANITGSVATGGTGTTPLTYIGRGSGTTEYFKGNIAHAAFYDVALTNTDVQNRVNASNDPEPVVMPEFRGWSVPL